MLDAKLEYCLDGYNVTVLEIDSFALLEAALNEIRNEAVAIKAIFSADVVGRFGRVSIGLDERSILCYTSSDFERVLTSLGDESAEGYTMYYFGDYSSMSNKYIVPYSKALKVLETWIKTGKLIDLVGWTDKIY